MKPLYALAKPPRLRTFAARDAEAQVSTGQAPRQQGVGEYPPVRHQQGRALVR